VPVAETGADELEPAPPSAEPADEPKNPPVDNDCAASLLVLVADRLAALAVAGVAR